MDPISFSDILPKDAFWIGFLSALALSLVVSIILDPNFWVRGEHQGGKDE